MYAVAARHRQLTIDDELTLYVRTSNRRRRQHSGDRSDKSTVTVLDRRRSRQDVGGRLTTERQTHGSARQSSTIKHTSGGRLDEKRQRRQLETTKRSPGKLRCYNYIVYKILSCCVLSLCKNYIVIGYKTAEVISCLWLTECVAYHCIRCVNVVYNDAVVF